MLVRRYGRVELLRVFRYMNSSVSGGAFPLRGAPPPPLVLGALGLGTEIDLDGFREAVGRSGLGARVSFRLGDCPSGYLPLENRLGRIRGGGRMDPLSDLDYIRRPSGVPSSEIDIYRPPCV